MRSTVRLVVLFLGAFTLAASPARAQDQPQSSPTLGEAAKDLWRRLPDSVKAKAKDKLVEIIEKSFGGARPAPPPPPPPTTAKEKAAAEKARKAELAKLKKLEQQRKAEEAKRQKAAKAAAAKAAKEAAKAEAKAKAAAAKAAKEGKPAPAPDPAVLEAEKKAAKAQAELAAKGPAIETLHEMAVPLERKGSSYYVGAKLNDQLEVSYLYDTGASLTTVDKATLAKLGVQIPEGAATIRTSTANGVVEVPLIVLDSIDVGGARVAGGFTVSLCEPCSDGRKIGLLGLNFSRRYLTTLDEGSKKLRLVPRVDALDHRFDVEPFLQYQGVKGQMRSGQLHVAGGVLNRAPRTATKVKVVAVLVDANDKELARVPGSIGTIPAGGTTQFQFSGKAPGFSKFYLELDGADW